MKIKALKGLVIRDSSSGKLTPIAQGAIADVDSTEGNALITEGLAVTGTKSITENGTGIDVMGFAEVNVNVGGSSDFSTAEVVVNNYATSSLLMPYFDGDKMKSFSTISGTYTVPLYKGELYVTSEFGAAQAAFTAISGNVAYDSTTLMFKITGNCTLQIGEDKPH